MMQAAYGITAAGYSLKEHFDGLESSFVSHPWAFFV